MQAVGKQSIAWEQVGKKEDAEEEQEKVKAYVCLARWGSCENQMASSGTKEVSETMPLLSGWEGWCRGSVLCMLGFRLFEG